MQPTPAGGPIPAGIGLEESMMSFSRIAFAALAFALLFGSCDRVNTIQDSESPAPLDFTFGVWNDSAQARSDSLRVDHPFAGSLTVGDTLWVRVRFEGDTSSIRFAKLFLSGKQQLVSLPIFVPVVWSDTGAQQVKFGVFTAFDSYFDSMKVVITDRTPTLRLPTRPGDGTVRIKPDTTTSFSVAVDDDGRVDSIRWDLDGDGRYDTATLARDTLRIRWSIERILRARDRSMIRVMARDDDRHEALDSIPLSFVVPPPTLALTGPDTVSVGDTLRFQATASGSAPLGAIAWPDGATGSSWLLVAPARDTQLTIRAIVRDSLGGADTAETRVAVILDAPRVVPQDTLRVHAGRPLHLSGGATQRFGSIARWGWDLDNDGVYGSKDTTSGIDTTYETPGIRIVRLKAVDDDGQVGVGQFAVSVTDSVPTLVGPTVPRSSGPRDTLALSIAATDPDGDSLVVSWIVDGDTTRGAVRKVAFDSVGIHVVRALVRSYTPAGTALASIAVSDSIVVVADPPRLDLGRDSTIAWGGTWKALGATASDSTGSIVSTTWDWNGDGTWDTSMVGWATPLHRFAADTGRVVVRARVTDDDGNQVVDSLALRADPAPWAVAITAPATSARLSDILVHLNWTDSIAAASSVRWTSNEGLDASHTPSGDADSIVVQGKLVDTLRITATLTSPSGAVTTRITRIVLDSLRAGPSIRLSAPDTVSWSDTIRGTATIAGSVAPSSVTWWNLMHGLTASLVAPAKDTTITLKARVVDSLGRIDSASKTVVVVRDAPVADAGENLAVHAGRSLHLSGAATQKFGNIVGWRWDLDHDGVFGPSSLSAGIDTTWETIGPRTVVLRVQDDDGNVAFDTLVVNVTDSVPTLALAVPASATVLDSIELVATATDADGDSLRTSWIVDGDTTTGASRRVAFPAAGSQTVTALVRSYTPAGTFLAQATRTDTVQVASTISVRIQHADTLWFDTTSYGTPLQADIVSPAGLDSIFWSFDGGSSWFSGDIAGFQTWLPSDTGTGVAIVRVVDRFGASDSDTARVVSLRDRPAIDLPDTTQVFADSPDRVVTLVASVRFGGISEVRWTWTDLDGPHQFDQYPEGGTSVTLSLDATFPPGRFPVAATVFDNTGESTLDTTIVVSTGIRVSLAAPDTVATGSNVHATGSVISWPADSALQLSLTFDQSSAADSVLDARMPSAGPHTVTFGAAFLGSQAFVSKSRSVEGVDDIPQIESFEPTTIAAGVPQDLSFQATRRIGSIRAWVWDLSAAKGSDNTLLGTATDANTAGGSLMGAVFEPGSRPVGYGVVTDGGDTVWAQRYFDVVGAPLAVDDTLGESRRTGLDIGCEVGTDCDIPAYLVLDNDLSGLGMESSPTLKASLDGTNIDSNSDGSWIHLPAPASAGVATFRYIITNGWLDDTGTVDIRIYERTEPAVLDTSKYPLPVANAFTETNGTWAPQYTNWSLNFPAPAGTEFVNFHTTYPEITGASLLTGNVLDPNGGETAASQGADLLAIDPSLGFHFDYGTADWMKGEEEVVHFYHNISTRRLDGAGIPGALTWSQIDMPVRFRRYVNTNVAPTANMRDFSASYDCAGKASFDYVYDVAAVKNPHDGDVVALVVFDGTFANGGAGYGDGAIKGSFTSLDGKTTIEIPFKQNEKKDFVGELPATGGVLQVHYELSGFLDEKGNPVGQVQQMWVPYGYNPKSSVTQTSKGGAFHIDNGCVVK